MLPVVVPISGYFATDVTPAPWQKSSLGHWFINPSRFLACRPPEDASPISEEVMVPEKTTPNRSGSPTKSATKRARPSKASRAPAPASKRSAEMTEGNPRVTPLDAAPSLAERVQVERKQIFKALSIVECCRFATATLLEVGDTERMIPAFESVCDLLNGVAEELEGIASACERVGFTRGG
jgi:hypothetical protein